MEQNKPIIRQGICDFCGIPAYKCEHWSGLIDQEGNKIKQEVNQTAGTNVVTPQNYKKNNKRILIGCADFSNLTGMPMYLYNLSRGLIELGYEVHLVSMVGGEMERLGWAAGMYLYAWNGDYGKNDYSALILNEPVSAVLLKQFPNVPAYNIIHSARIEDEPIPNCPQIRKYLCSKDSDRDYVRARVPAKKIGMLNIPIDPERFKVNVKDKRKYYDKKDKPNRVLAVCTLDPLRTPMLEDLVARARMGEKVTIVGKPCGWKLLESRKHRNLKVIEGETLDLQPYFDDCDEVAGIFKGTITLEAWALGKKTSVYDEKGNYEMVPRPADFDKKHDYRNVAKELDRILNEKWADILVPHHDQPELLNQFLRSVPIKNYNVVIYRGGYFSQACNRAAEIAKTDTLIFSNDDIVVTPQILWELCDTDEDLVGVRQLYPNGNRLCVGIKINEDGKYHLVNEIEEADYPSGAFFKMKTSLWNKLGGFNEGYINGGEDQDLFLRALEKGATVYYLDNHVVHYCSQSSGRFDFIEHNDNKFYTEWPRDRLEKILGKFYLDKNL